MLRKLILISAIIGLPYTPAIADDNDTIVRIDNPAAVALSLRDEGYRARLSETESGRAYILSGSGGIHFEIHFYFCEDNVDCQGILFSAAFDLLNGTSHELMNEWNRDRLFGRAYVDDECDPVLDYYLSVDSAFETTDFLVLLEDWGIAISDFSDFIDFDDEEGSVVMDCGSDTNTL